MRKRLGRVYYGFAGVAAVAMAASVALAGPAPAPDGAAPLAVARDVARGDVARGDGQAGAVGTCLDAAAARYEGEVRLAQVNRAWEGTEGWIVDLSLDVARADGRTRRRDAMCRQSDHGLQLARY